MELKLCPFCGKAAENSGKGYALHPGTPKCILSGWTFDAEKWNTRPPEGTALTEMQQAGRVIIDLCSALELAADVEGDAPESIKVAWQNGCRWMASTAPVTPLTDSLHETDLMHTKGAKALHDPALLHYLLRDAATRGMNMGMAYLAEKKDHAWWEGMQEKIPRWVIGEAEEDGKMTPLAPPTDRATPIDVSNLEYEVDEHRRKGPLTEDGKRHFARAQELKKKISDTLRVAPPTEVREALRHIDMADEIFQAHSRPDLSTTNHYDPVAEMYRYAKGLEEKNKTLRALASTPSPSAEVREAAQEVVRQHDAGFIGQGDEGAIIALKAALASTLPTDRSFKKTRWALCKQCEGMFDIASIQQCPKCHPRAEPGEAARPEGTGEAGA